MSRLTYLLAGLCLVLAVGCSSDPESEADAGRPSATASQEPSASATRAPASKAPKPTASHAPKSTAPAAGSVARRCGPPDVAARRITLRGPGRDRLAAVVVGDGPVTAVYSHQTDAIALCGFWPFAVWLAQEYGIRSVLVDHCGSGDSSCAFDDFSEDRAGQLRPAIDWARDHGASRIGLVGASLGGTTVVVAAAKARVDAVIDLSGPTTWPGLNAMRAAPKVTEPTLLALARTDSIASPDGFQRLRSALGSKTTAYVETDYGHGWDLLSESVSGPLRPTRLAETIASWLQGDYVGS